MRFLYAPVTGWQKLGVRQKSAGIKQSLGLLMS